MPGRIFAIAQRKGGAGKTTLAAQLAVTWTLAGRSVAILDIDPQASLSQWRKIRAEDPALKPIALHATTGWRADSEIHRLSESHEIVIVDTPPHAETEARVTIRAADLVVVPVQPTPMDVWTAGATLALAKNEGVSSIIVLNRVPPRARLTADMMTKLQEYGAPIADARLGSRVAYAASLLHGKGAGEYEPSGDAAREVTLLCDELYARASIMTFLRRRQQARVL
jgi:chromosome partitioning protein